MILLDIIFLLFKTQKCLTEIFCPKMIIVKWFCPLESSSNQLRKRKSGGLVYA